MAEVFIKLTDKEDGTLGIQMEFNPPAEEGQAYTPATYMASTFLKVLGEETEQQGEEVDDA